MRLLIVEPLDVPACWERIRGHVEKAVALNPDRGLDKVYESLCRGRYRAFVVEGEIDGAVIGLPIITEDDERHFSICYVGGRISPPKARNVETLMSALEAVAEQLDCTSVTITGRLGWIRYLARLGYARAEDDGPLPQFRKAL